MEDDDDTGVVEGLFIRGLCDEPGEKNEESQEILMPTFTIPRDKSLESILDELTDAAGLKVAEFYGGDDAHPDLKDSMRRALKGVLRRNVRISDPGESDRGPHDHPRRKPETQRD